MCYFGKPISATRLSCPTPSVSPVLGVRILQKCNRLVTPRGENVRVIARQYAQTGSLH